MILSLATLAMLMAPGTIKAQNFDDYFTDKTLRVDYTFAGNQKQQMIAVDELNVMPRWYGKRQRLADSGRGQRTDNRTRPPLGQNHLPQLLLHPLPGMALLSRGREEHAEFRERIPRSDAERYRRHHPRPANNRREITTTLTHQVAPKDILIHQKGNKPTPYVTLQQAADTTRCIHIAYVAEGYTDAEMPVFLKDAQEATEAIFAHEPFKSMRDRFNIVAVKSPSKQSGPSIPAQGIWHETALSSHFDTFYSDRYLTTLHLKDLHNWLAGTP